MRTYFSAAIIGIATISMLGLSSTTADAKIVCKGPYQVVKGVGTIATPYCEDNFLAVVARGYGMKVSNKTVRNNPNEKERVCRFIGHDNRVSHICSQYNDSRDRSY